MITSKQLGKIWTDSVAYVMLLAGAGLSILFNVVNTLTVRGAAVDWVDWVIAIGAPALVVGMVEMFVNSRWIGQPWYMQTLRWLGSLGIGVVAMRMSWTHGHALLLERDQTSDVAVWWPMAIDFLAIMATALILSGRGQQDNRLSTPVDNAVDNPAGRDNRLDISQMIEDSSLGQDLGTTDYQAIVDSLRTAQDTSITWTSPADVPPLGVDIPNQLPSWLDGLADRVSTGPSMPAAPLPNRRPLLVPGQAPRGGSTRLSDDQRLQVRELTSIGREYGMYAVGEIRELLAAWFGVSTKTIQRAEVAEKSS